MRIETCIAAAASALALLAPLATRAQTPEMTMPAGEMEWAPTFFILFDELEVAARTTTQPIAVDARAWYGGASRRVWLRAEGDFATTGDNAVEAELQLLYGQLVHPFWDAVVGARVDLPTGGDEGGRTHLVLGLMGLSPFRFELEPSVFVSARGDVSARLEAEYPLLVTQRLVLEPGFSVDAALQAVPRYGVRSGINNYETALRLRYEIKREFAPYVGWVNRRPVGNGAVDGTETVGTRFTAGLRFWY